MGSLKKTLNYNVKMLKNILCKKQLSITLDEQQFGEIKVNLTIKLSKNKQTKQKPQNLALKENKTSQNADAAESNNKDTQRN